MTGPLHSAAALRAHLGAHLGAHPAALRVLGVMAKYWQPGEVKTRLANSLALQSGPEIDTMRLAAEVHQRFLCHLLDALSQAGDVRELVGSPPSRLGDFHRELTAARIAAWQITDQGDGNLGDRMDRWFAKQIHDKTRATEPNAGVASLLIGADCPLISSNDLDLAWSALTSHDVVLGPAHDGGYYLIGLSDRLSRMQRCSLFSKIQWSTDVVLRQTLDAARQAGLSVSLLDPQHDVDTAGDLRHLIRCLAAGDAPATALLAQLRSLPLPDFETQ